MPRTTDRDVWLSPDSFATTLLVLFTDRYGTEGLQWHPETIRMQLAQDVTPDIPEPNLDRFLAAVTLVTTNYFWKRLPYFIEICNVLSGDSFSPDVFRPADALDCAWGLTESLLICPPDEAEPLDDEIRHYISFVLADEGFIKPPDILRVGFDADRANQVSTDWADDPELYSAVFSTQMAKTTEIEETIKDSLQNLMRQIVALPLEHGNTEAIFKRLRQDIHVAA